MITKEPNAKEPLHKSGYCKQAVRHKHILPCSQCNWFKTLKWGLFRSWQPDSYGTGGILADDYRQLQWFKVNALTGGTSYMSTGMQFQMLFGRGRFSFTITIKLLVL